MNSIIEKYFAHAGAQEKIKCMAGAEERVSNGTFEHWTPGSPAGPSLPNPSSCINYCSLAVPTALFQGEMHTVHCVDRSLTTAPQGETSRVHRMLGM